MASLRLSKGDGGADGVSFCFSAGARPMRGLRRAIFCAEFDTIFPIRYNRKEIGGRIRQNRAGRNGAFR